MHAYACNKILKLLCHTPEWWIGNDIIYVYLFIYYYIVYDVCILHLTLVHLAFHFSGTKYHCISKNDGMTNLKNQSFYHWRLQIN